MAEALNPSGMASVIGAGAMGAGIAQIAAAAGHPVRLYDTRAEAAQCAIEDIRKTFAKLADKGRMTHEAAVAAGNRLRPADSITDLAESVLVVEAIVENLEVKRKLFSELEAVVGDECILASNTSSISITSVAAGLRIPKRMLGMHFFNPAPLMALVEVVSGLATDPAIAEIIFATAASWGKSPVYAKSTPGFIVNRVARPFYAEGLRLLTERAAEASTLDALMREAGGFRMGPFELMDLIGHDVNYAVTESVFNAYYNDPRFAPSLIQLELVNAGFLGRKSGRGFYQYGEGAVAAAPQTEAPQPRPQDVTLRPEGGLADTFAVRFNAASLPFTWATAPHEDGRLMDVGRVPVYITDGRSATQRANTNSTPNTVLVDLALDYTKASRIGLSAALQCSEQAFQAVVGLFQGVGFAVSRLRDVPGMVVMRTVAMLANEAADAVNQGVCTVEAADLAMQKGVNYPRGPLAWADAVGVSKVQAVLANLSNHYGEDRYRVSPLIREKVWADVNFHE